MTSIPVLDEGFVHGSYLWAPAFVPYSCPNKSLQTWGLKAKATFTLWLHSFGDQKLKKKTLKSPHSLPLSAGGWQVLVFRA